jgi:hypothetical protein
LLLWEILIIGVWSTDQKINYDNTKSVTAVSMGLIEKNYIIYYLMMWRWRRSMKLLFEHLKFAIEWDIILWKVELMM